MITRKPSKRWCVETFTHKGSGTQLSVYYHKELHDFWCRVGSETIVAKSQPTCRQLSLDHANKILGAEDDWRRVIFISPGELDNTIRYHGEIASECVHTSESVRFAMLRAWVTHGADGRRYTRRWSRQIKNTTYDAEDLANKHDVQILYVPFDNPVELSYTEETWEALLRMSKMIASMRTRLDEIVRAADFAPQLLAHNNSMLLMSGVDE